MIAGTWLVFAVLAAGAGSLYLVVRLWRYRDKPGARWFLASLVCQVLACVGYADTAPRGATTPSA